VVAATAGVAIRAHRCTVGTVYVVGVPRQLEGPQTVTVSIPSKMKSGTVFVDVACQP
jgi:alanine dehydrogenase